MAQSALRPGDPSRIGRYRLVARLGAGGMGVVYLGASKEYRQVAIKVLRPELADDLEFRARFRREAEALARVQGVCTVRVIDADTESSLPFLATEYVDGPSLAEYVSLAGPLDAGMLYGLATGLAEAVVAIHAAGVVHRDLKPSNVLLTPAGPKVIDFGIAQALDATAVTRTGMTVGSPGFMAPEQVMGNAGPAADVFAWGLTVAFAASGRSPFGTGPTDAILYRILHDSPDVAAVPEQLRPVVAATLAKAPDERPAAPDLLRYLAPETSRPDASPFAATQAVLARTWLMPAGESPAVTSPHRGRRNLLLAVSAVAVAAIVGAGAALATGPFQEHPAGTAGARSVATRSAVASNSPAASANVKATSPAASASVKATPPPYPSCTPIQAALTAVMGDLQVSGFAAWSSTFASNSSTPAAGASITTDHGRVQAAYQAMSTLMNNELAHLTDPAKQLASDDLSDTGASFADLLSQPDLTLTSSQVVGDDAVIVHALSKSVADIVGVCGASPQTRYAPAQEHALDDLAALHAEQIGGDSAYLGDIAQTRADLKQEQQGVTDVRLGGIPCPPTDQVSMPFTHVQSDEGQFGQDLQVTKDVTLAAAQREEAALRTDLATLTAQGLTPPAGAAAAAHGVGTLADQLVTTVNADVDTENSLVQQAYATAESVAGGGTAGCPGYNPGAMPAYLSHITG